MPMAPNRSGAIQTTSAPPRAKQKSVSAALTDGICESDDVPRSIPAILFFKDGKLVDQVIGFVGKPALAEKFKQHAAA